MFSKDYYCRYVTTRACLGKGYSLPEDKVWDLLKLKPFADDKMKVLQMMTSVCDRVENIVKKGKNAGNTGYKHFLLFPQCFQKSSLLGSLISNCMVKGDMFFFVFFFFVI